MTTKPTTFVLVHGAWWSGDWLWEGVAAPLRAQGHRVFTPALTGLGPRSHLLSPQISLTTHILDVVNLIKWEELSNIVLVGHSYGGMVISGVAEQVPEGTIRSIVYLDAFVPEDGQSLMSMAGKPEVIDGAPFPPPPVELPDGRGMALPLPPATVFGVTGVNGERMNRLGTPQPVGTAGEPVHLTGARERIPVKTYIWAERTPSDWPRQQYERLSADPAWRRETLACNHMTMLEKPEETTEAFLRAAVA